MCHLSTSETFFFPKRLFFFKVGRREKYTSILPLPKKIPILEERGEWCETRRVKEVCWECPGNCVFTACHRHTLAGSVSGHDVEMSGAGTAELLF